MMTVIRNRQVVRHILGIVLLSIACMTYASGGTESPIPFKRESPAEDAGISRIVIGFGIAMLALGVSLYLLRRRLGENIGGTSGANQVRVLETRRLTPRSTLFVIEFAGVRYLIAESGQSLACLGTAPSQAVSNTGQAQ